MKIRSVRAYLLSYPFPKPIELQYYGGMRKIVKRDSMLIRVETENGLVGYAPGEASEAAQTTIHDLIAPFLVGRICRKSAHSSGPGLRPPAAKSKPK